MGGNDEQQRFRFLARPWYRDWGFSCIIIAAGFMLSSPGGPFQGWPGLVVIGIGSCILLTAAAHGVVTIIRRV
jgi:hypothetical protein